LETALQKQVFKGDDASIKEIGSTINAIQNRIGEIDTIAPLLKFNIKGTAFGKAFTFEGDPEALRAELEKTTPGKKPGVFEKAGEGEVYRYKAPNGAEIYLVREIKSTAPKQVKLTPSELADMKGYRWWYAQKSFWEAAKQQHFTYDQKFVGSAETNLKIRDLMENGWEPGEQLPAETGDWLKQYSAKQAPVAVDKPASIPVAPPEVTTPVENTHPKDTAPVTPNSPEPVNEAPATGGDTPQPTTDKPIIDTPTTPTDKQPAITDLPKPTTDQPNPTETNPTAEPKADRPKQEENKPPAEPPVDQPKPEENKTPAEPTKQPTVPEDAAEPDGKRPKQPEQPVTDAEGKLTDYGKWYYARPSRPRIGRKMSIWEMAKDSNGVVKDAVDKTTELTAEDWRIEEKPERSFQQRAEDAAKRKMGRKEFLDDYNDPSNYRVRKPIVREGFSGERPPRPEQTTLDEEGNLTDYGRWYYERPSGYHAGVRDKVWAKAVENAPGGVVHDPISGDVIEKDSPWEMGHKPGFEFWKHRQASARRGISRTDFINEYNFVEDYRPETKASNSSHKGEAPDNVYIGPGKDAFNQ
jgi:hypothetical protein